MDGYIVGSMISANSITGEQIQANSIKTANLELSVQKKIQDATNEETVKALIKADLDGFESTLSKEFVTVENATTQIQQATEVAVKEATQSIIDNAVSESMGAVDGQLNDKLNQYTSGTLLPAINEKAEEVLQNAEDYVVTQLESYATKQELSSSISQTREQIELSVSEKYTTKTESATIITEAIDGITVGAINRALGTGENKSFKFNGGANETWLPYKFSNDISNKEVFVSFNYTLTGTAQNGSQIEFAPSYLKKTNNQTVYRPKHIFFTSNRLQDVNITDTVSFTTKDFQDISPSSTSYIRFVGNGFTGTLSISEVQIKPGNSKTTWSPAPEDTISDINDAKNEAINAANNTLISTIANHYTKSETDSKISVAKNEINLGVSNTYETKTNVETKVASTLNSAKSYSDTKKTEAINTASTDATNKANQAKTDAINSANNTLTTTIANYYTKTQTDSQINVAKNAITQSVSENYYSKNEFANSSVLNLIMNGGFENGTEHWERNKDFTDSKDIWFPHDSSISWVIWADRHSGFYQRFSCIIGKTYSWSADVYIETGCGNIGIEGLTSRYWYEGGWTKISGTFTATSTIHTFIIYGDYDTTTIIHIDNIMVCEGAIPHPYQPNYIDINSRLKLAEQKITPDAIINTVRHEVYTKSETEDVINNKGYATQAQVTHTAEQVEYRFSQSGGYNLIRNGGFENGITHWSLNNSPNIIENQNWQNYDGKSIYISATSHGSGIYQLFPTTVGKVYSYSFYAQAEYGEWWAGVENAHAQNVAVSPNNWVRYTGTFTATSTSHAFICYAHGGGRNVFIDNVMICEGVLPSAFTPHPSEIYDGITTIDKDGVKVVHGNSYSRLGAHGLMRYDGDVGKYYHYLSYMGQVDLASEERATIQLPPEFRNRDFKVIVSVKRVRMNYDPYAEKHLLMGFYAEVNSINTANATFEVYASVRAIKSTNFNGSITGADYGHDTLRPVVAYWVYA